MLSLCCFLPGLAVFAQQPTFRTGTRTVALYATVTDAQKRLVPDLTQEEFEVFDNEKPQTIDLFISEVQPITVVVMLDTSASMTGNLKLLERAAEQFLIRMLPKDKGMVGAFNDKIEFFPATFTSNRDTLISSLRELDFGNPTRLYDAIAASMDRMNKIDGRRVVLVFTDGDDTNSRVSHGDVLEQARLNEVMIYAVGLRSDYFNGSRQVRTQARRWAETAGRRNRRWVLRAGEDGRPRPDLHARRAGAAQPIRSGLYALAARRQGPSSQCARQAAGHDGSRAPQLSRLS